jgi:glycosyltransferase involved in cell wall biosynthesis
MLLSVCIPTYQRPDLLRFALEAWRRELEGLEGKVEVIVGDNGACDATRDLCAAAGSPSVRYVRHEKNLLFNGNVQRLLQRHVAGTYAWICGDDDFIHRGALREIVASLEAHPEFSYFYVNFRYLPFEACTPETLRDAEHSPVGILENGDTRSRVLPRVAEIVALSSGGFTGSYTAIWRREEALRAFPDGLSPEAFLTLEGTVPHACHIVRHLLEKPCYYFGGPLLTASHSVSWRSYGPLFTLHWMPRYYDLLERHGIDGRLLDPARRSGLRGAWKKFRYLLQNRHTAYGRPFSPFRFAAGHARFPEFYQMLFEGFGGRKAIRFFRRFLGRHN